HQAARPRPGRRRVVLAAWGRFVHHRRVTVLLLSALTLIPAVWLVLRGGTFDNNPVPRFTESGRAIGLIEQELPKRPPSFGLILSSSEHKATSPAFETAVRQALEPLRADARVERVVTPYDDPMPDSGRVSRDGYRVLVTV